MTREEYNGNVFQLASDVLDQMILRVCEKPKLVHYFLMFAPVVLASYLFVCRNLHGERDLIEKGEAWLGLKRKPRVAWFTDSFVNMDGVSKTCRMFLQAAQLRDAELHIITSHEDDLSHMNGVVHFKPIKKFPHTGMKKYPCMSHPSCRYSKPLRIRIMMPSWSALPVRWDCWGWCAAA